MKPFPTAALGCVSLLGIAALSPAQAGWQSVFQVTCQTNSAPVVSRYEPDPCNPCPQPVVTTRYVQRCYYQPEVSYQTRTYYEPVTTYRTSYYYEPVTCWRYSCYYDPCTCRYREVATPQVSYSLKARCCPVRSWVQRCCSVPVTTYKKCCYWEAQSCYSLADPCAPYGPSAAVPVAPAPQPAQVPIVTDPPAATVSPGVQEYRNGGTGSPLYDQRYNPPPSTPMNPALPEGSGSSYRHKTWKAPAPAQVPAAKPRPPTPLRLDGIAFEDAKAAAKANLVGIIVQEGSSLPKAGARIVIVSETQNSRQHTATADQAGKFQVQLASGRWLLYVRNNDDRPVLLSKLDVKSNEVQQMTLVSR